MQRIRLIQIWKKSCSNTKEETYLGEKTIIGEKTKGDASISVINTYVPAFLMEFRHDFQIYGCEFV